MTSKLRFGRLLRTSKALLVAAGSDRQRVLKVHAYLTDLANFQAFNDVYSSFFNLGVKPARTTVMVAGLPGMSTWNWMR
jgi:2-iminobutanoate/2-iminopropanoate deaminase